MNKLKNVVVGVDFSNRSKAALREAARLAHANRAQVHVVHVVEEEAAEALAKHEQRELSEVCNELMNSAGEMMDSWAADIDLPDSTSSRVIYGQPVEQLIQQVVDVKGDVLIVGVRGIVNDAKGAGARATRLVRRAPCKVLLVEGSHTQGFKRAVACIDFSKVSEKVVEQAIHMAELDGSDLYFLHIHTAPRSKFHYLFGSESPVTEVDNMALKNELVDKLRDFVGDTGDAWTSFHVECDQHRGEAIDRFCAAKNADLVILGTRGHTSLKYYLMGSTAEYLLSERPCSVLAVCPSE